MASEITLPAAVHSNMYPRQPITVFILSIRKKLASGWNAYCELNHPFAFCTVSILKSRIKNLTCFQDFTKKQINVLDTGAAILTHADTDQEGAKTLTLHARQQQHLPTALLPAFLPDQNILRLF